MTDRAVVGEQLLARVDVGPRGRQIVQRPDVTNNIENFVVLQHAVAAEGGHGAFTRTIHAGTNAVPNGEGDIVKLAAPQPFVIVQVGITLRTATTCAMTRRTVFSKRWLAYRARKIEQLRISYDLLQRRAGEL